MDEPYASNSERAPSPHQSYAGDVQTKPPSSLSAHEQGMLSHLDDLRLFLITAPYNHASGQVAAFAPDHHPALNRFPLPNGELVSCIYWQSLYHITGTDIVRALVFRFEAFGRPVRNMKKFEEGIFSDLRNLKPGVDACLEDPKSPFLELLFKYQCIRTQKKQKVFYWFSVPHDRLFLDALERDIKREKMHLNPTTEIVGEPARSFVYDPRRSLYDQFIQGQGGIDGESDLERAIRLRENINSRGTLPGRDRELSNAADSDIDIYQSSADEGQSGGSTLTNWPSGVTNDDVSQLPLFPGASLVGSSLYYKRRKKCPPASSESVPTVRRSRNDRLPHYPRYKYASDAGGSASSSTCQRKVSDLCLDQKGHTGIADIQLEPNSPTHRLSHPSPHLNPSVHIQSPTSHYQIHDPSYPPFAQCSEVLKDIAVQDILPYHQPFGQTNGYQQTIHSLCNNCPTPIRQPVEDSDDPSILARADPEGSKISPHPRHSYPQSLNDGIAADVHNRGLNIQSQRSTYRPHYPCLNNPPSAKIQQRGSAQPVHSSPGYQHTLSSHIPEHPSPPQRHRFKMEGPIISSLSFPSATTESTTLNDTENIFLPSLVSPNDGDLQNISFIPHNPIMYQRSSGSHTNSKPLPPALAEKPALGRRLPYSSGVGVSKTGWRETKIGPVRRHHSIPLSAAQYQSSHRHNQRNAAGKFDYPRESGSSLTRASSSASSTSSGDRIHRRVPELPSYDSNEASDISSHGSGLITVQNSHPFTPLLHPHVSASPSHFALSGFSDEVPATFTSTHTDQTSEISSDFIHQRLDHWDQLCPTDRNTLIHPIIPHLDGPGHHDLPLQ